MNELTEFQLALEETYPSLTFFSDLNWSSVFKEYLASHEQRPTDLEQFVSNFPQFLQQKSDAGECPEYLFELAYFELAQIQTLRSDIESPSTHGLHLNPTAVFLNFEFDILDMLDQANKGSFQINSRPHLLCLFKDSSNNLKHFELGPGHLEMLKLLEDSPKNRNQFKDIRELEKLIKENIILEK